MKKSVARITLLAALAIPAPLLGADLQTDWIEPVQGYEEGALKAKLRAREVSPADGNTTVTISIPKSSLSDREAIDEVIVYGKQDDQSEPELEIRHEWVADYDQDNYGLVLYLGKNGNIPLRLFFRDQGNP
ncbi:MAG: hypothetical protein WC997_00195 [Porticoccaceae bacterium]